MANPLGIDLNELERYETFEKGAVPCIFKLQVQEGFCRFNITEQENLNILLVYCKKKHYEVNWTSAVLKEDPDADVYKGFPGGLYIATCQNPEDILSSNNVPMH